MLLRLGIQTLAYGKITHDTVVRLVLLLVHSGLTSDERPEP